MDRASPTLRVEPGTRIVSLADPGSAQPYGRWDDSIACAEITVADRPLAVTCLHVDRQLEVGSGEALTQSIERATRRRLPFLLIATSSAPAFSGGALQVVKALAALARLRAARLLHLALLADPSVGALAPCLAAPADLVLAEPDTRISFFDLPVRSGVDAPAPAAPLTAEALLRHGMIDRIVPEWRLRAVLGTVLRLYAARSSSKSEQPLTSLLVG